MDARILFDDGTVIIGKSFGASGTAFGEIVFNTGMTGYQEILTDPSYGGQVVTMTYPLIGNYGVNCNDVESDSVKVSGFIVKGYAKKPSHWQMSEPIDTYLERNKIIGVYDVDTRMITKKIRNNGAMNCLITTDMVTDIEELKAQLKQFIFPANIVELVSSKVKKTYECHVEQAPHIAVIDFGIKSGIIAQLLKNACDVTVFPYNATYADIMEFPFDAVLFSNGPGDPKECVEGIELAKQLLHTLPLFGICLGHQILALSLGANTYKLKFGHRGSNHPVIDLRTNKVYMTSQNHGYAVEVESMIEGMTYTHMNVNDQTVEGFAYEKGRIMSVQFHPEEGPGPTDATVIFNEWIDTLRRDF